MNHRHSPNLYDFGDGWRHTIRVTDFKESDPHRYYPVLVGGCGRCPPEDVGGPPGYGKYLEAIADPSHERHEELRNWGPKDFNPEHAPMQELKDTLVKIAAAWNY